MAEFSMGMVWGLFNFLCGLFIFIWSFFFFTISSALNMLFGLTICFLSITHRWCDAYVLAWFPYWENFLFTGLAFIYFSSGVFYVHFGDYFFYGFAQLFVFAIGVVYVIIWLLNKFAHLGIEPPIQLIVICGGEAAGGGAGGGGGAKPAGGANGGNSGGAQAASPASGQTYPPPAPMTTGGGRPGGGPPPPPPV